MSNVKTTGGGFVFLNQEIRQVFWGDVTNRCEDLHTQHVWQEY